MPRSHPRSDLHSSMGSSISAILRQPGFLGSAESARPDFWDKPEAAQSVLKEQNEIRDQVATFERLRKLLGDAGLFLTMADDDGGDNSEAAQEAQKALEAARGELQSQEFRLMLSGEHDR